METSSRPLHVVVFSLENEPSLVVPSFGKDHKVELFRTQSEGQDAIAHKLAAKSFLAGAAYNLKGVNALGTLEAVEDEDGTVSMGYAVRLTQGIHDEGRNFSVRQISLSTIADYIEQQPAHLNPIDRTFIDRSFTLPLVEASIKRASTSLGPLENQR